MADMAASLSPSEDAAAEVSFKARLLRPAERERVAARLQALEAASSEASDEPRAVAKVSNLESYLARVYERSPLPAHRLLKESYAAILVTAKGPQPSRPTLGHLPSHSPSDNGENGTPTATGAEALNDDDDDGDDTSPLQEGFLLLTLDTAPPPALPRAWERWLRDIFPKLRQQPRDDEDAGGAADARPAAAARAPPSFANWDAPAATTTAPAESHQPKTADADFGVARVGCPHDRSALDLLNTLWVSGIASTFVSELDESPQLEELEEESDGDEEKCVPASTKGDLRSAACAAAMRCLFNHLPTLQHVLLTIRWVGGWMNRNRQSQLGASTCGGCLRTNDASNGSPAHCLSTE
eukprot:GHVU01213743.1.p1 GENE.GHVU01213743.1~~GHVU01213743.1.p1  ORF type:complete len:354 (-),score=60.24 GHVU01213743.1:714-1775(-)